MIVCHKCGRENEDRYKFCLGCGAPLGAQASMPSPDSSNAQKLEAIETASQTMVDEPIPAQIAATAEVGMTTETPAVQLPTPESKPAPIDRSCTNCGNAVPPDFVFCGKCGTRYEEPSAAPSAVPDIGSSGGVRSPLRGRLVLIHPDGTEGDTIGLMEGENVLGRASNVEALAGDEYLSPEHIKITCNDNGIIVEDVGSLNGTFLRLDTRPRTLEHNDMIRVGQELLRYSSPSQQVPLLVSDDEETDIHGSPNSNHWGLLHLVVGPNIESNVYVLHGDEQVVGRETGNILFRDDGFVSGQHARLTPSESGTAELQDLDSSNGTYVRLRAPYTARDGDFLLLGQQLFNLLA